jgi:segregation and condensation protein B
VSDLSRTVEALLFLSPQPVSARDLAEATEATEGQVEEALGLLRDDLAEGKRGVVLREVAGGFSLASDPDSEAAARRLLAKPRTPPLTQAQAETLAIVAYLQPVTRPEVARIRGVTSESAVQTLAERGLIEESGRSQFGAAIFKTTELFERLFGLSGLEQLPDPSKFDPTPEDERELRERLLKAGEQRVDPAEPPRCCPAGPSPGPSGVVRLAKFLAHGGVASRRKAELIIGKGRVTVGGKVVTDPARDVGDGDDVRVDGSLVGTEALEVWAVNKPAGVVSTAREPGSRPAVVGLVDSAARLYPVGRLDVDSTGLLLLTNDGALANRLTHPRYGVAKAYRAELRRPPSDADLRRLASGVELEDGMTAPAELRRMGEREVELTLREGRNRQVRRMAEAVGNRVVSLRRVRFGSVELGSLSQGQARRLSEVEIARLWEDSEP